MFDSHAHYEDERFDTDRSELLDNLFRTGITGIINCGSDEQTSLHSLELSERYENIYFTAGVHPENSPLCGNFEDWLEPMLSHPKCVGIGEIGLDYHYDTPKECQRDVLVRQLEIADKLNKRVVIHNRESHRDLLDIVSLYPGVRGIFHSFSGSAEYAEILVKKGWYISFSGVITFKNAEKPVRVAAVVPTDKILCETDCPYLTPHPHRGLRNHSGYLEFTIKKLAEIKGIAFEEMENITTDNAKTLFGIK